MAAQEPYFTIIARHLEARGEHPDDYKLDAIHRQAVYLIRMANELTSAINERATAPVSLKTVLLKESTASGHTDYHRKLAWYCHELAQGRSAP